jgi:hypothetical protein
LKLHPFNPDEEEVVEVIDLVQETSFEEIELTSQAPSKDTTSVSSSKVVDNLYNIEITNDAIPKINICIIPPCEEEIPVSCVSLRSPTLKLRDKSNEEKQKNLISILKKVSDSLDKSPAKRKSVNFNLPPNTTPTRSSSRLQEKANNEQELNNTFVLTQKFFIIIETYFNNYIKDLRLRNEVHPVLARAFHWTKTIDIYLQLVKTNMMASKKLFMGSSDGGAKPKKCSSSSEEYSKKLHRNMTDNRSLIMHNNRNKCMVEKDCSYAFNYLDRVKKTLSEYGDDELFMEFMSTLSSFDSDRESVPDLYHVSLIITCLSKNSITFILFFSENRESLLAKLLRARRSFSYIPAS